MSGVLSAVEIVSGDRYEVPSKIAARVELIMYVEWLVVGSVSSNVHSSAMQVAALRA